MKAESDKENGNVVFADFTVISNAPNSKVWHWKFQTQPAWKKLLILKQESNKESQVENILIAPIANIIKLYLYDIEKAPKLDHKIITWREIL